MWTSSDRRYFFLLSTAACFAIAGGGATAVAGFLTGPGRGVVRPTFEAAVAFGIAWIALTPRTVECDLPGLMDAIGLGAVLITASAAARVFIESKLTSQVAGCDGTFRQPVLASLAIGLISASLFG